MRQILVNHKLRDDAAYTQVGKYLLIGCLSPEIETGSNLGELSTIPYSDIEVLALDNEGHYYVKAVDGEEYTFSDIILVGQIHQFCNEHGVELIIQDLDVGPINMPQEDEEDEEEDEEEEKSIEDATEEDFVEGWEKRLLDTVKLWIGEDNKEPENHPYYKWVEKFIKGMSYLPYSSFRYIWGYALDEYYDEFGSGDVGSDWDGCDDTYYYILTGKKPDFL